MWSGRNWILVPLLVAILTGWAHAKFPGEEAATIEAIKRVKPSVVKIETRHPSARNTGIGSGVILRKDGFIITNFHVIRNAQTIKVYLPNGKTYPAQVWKASRERDLAIIKVNATDLPVPHFGNSDKVELGQEAIAIGSPLRFSWSVTVGTISAIGRDVSAQNTYYRNLIQTDAAINPGSSGGALANSKGEVIGINTLVYTGTDKFPHAQGLAFAIPINDALKIAQALVGKQNVGGPTGGPAWLGIDGKDVTREMADMNDWRARTGVLVKSVTAEGPAASAGIKKGDVITEADGTAVHGLGDLRGVINRHKAGDQINMVVWGLGKAKRAVQVTLETHER